MDTKTLKLDLVQKLLSTEDEEVLEAISRIFENATVAHSVSGEPLTEDAYNQKIAQAEKSIEEGKTFTTAQVKEQTRKWKK